MLPARPAAPFAKQDFANSECYQAVSYSLRDRLIELWNDTQTYFKCAPRALGRWRGPGR